MHGGQGVAGSAGLERWSRWLLWAAGISYAVTGLIFFAFPVYSAATFPWKVTDFMAMTIGGWTLGIGLMAVHTAWRGAFATHYPALILVWAFSLLELVVVVAFLGLLKTDNWLTWPYLLSLVLGTASGVAGVSVLWGMRRSLLRDSGGSRKVPVWMRGIYLLLILLTWGLALNNLLRGTVPGGNVFPEPLSGFTTQAFAAFFFSIGLGAVPLLFNRDVRPHIAYARTGLYLIVLITIAALIYINRFDFTARPGGLFYLGAYILAGIVIVAMLMWDRARPETV
jgi:hypothetical protein